MYALYKVERGLRLMVVSPLSYFTIANCYLIDTRVINLLLLSRLRNQTTLPPSTLHYYLHRPFVPLVTLPLTSQAFLRVSTLKYLGALLNITLQYINTTIDPGAYRGIESSRGTIPSIGNIFGSLIISPIISQTLL